MAGVVCVGPKPAMATTTTTRVSNSTTPASLQQSKQEQRHASQKASLNEKQLQRIDQQQSLAMVQIMLHASFGTLFYLREFLPLSCFSDCDLLSLSNKGEGVSYEDFARGKSSSENENFGKRGQPLKTILRGRDEKADSLLDLLEGGVFEALSKNILEAVQLTVFVDKDQPTHVLESYTFSFKYAGEVGDVNSRLASISLDSLGCTADMKTIRTARHGLEMIIRRLITLSTFLPSLPNKRYMEIHLFYTDDCPQEYEPPGFMSAPHNPLLYPHNELWTRETQSCGMMNSGFHSVGLKVTTLKWSGSERNDSSSRAQIPDTIDYSESVARDEDIGMDVPNEDIIFSQNCSQESTQTRLDEGAKKTLQKMLVTPTQDSDFIQTQLNTQAIGNASVVAKPELSQIKVTELRCGRGKSPSIDLAGGNLTQEKTAAAVDCQCGSARNDEDTIQCNFCNTRQHVICYGFLHANDPSIPDTHVCYKCLLEPQEQTLLREMDTLILLRRALKVISEEGYPNRVCDFAKKLDCNGNTVTQITNMLKKQGYIQATKGSKHKGFLNRGLPKFQISDSPSVQERLRKEIFNPLAKITHHYIIPEGWQNIPNGADGVHESLLGCSQSAKASGESPMHLVSEQASPANNPRLVTPGARDRESQSLDPRNMVGTQDSFVLTRRRRQQHQDMESQDLGIPETQQSRDDTNLDGGLRLRKKRKLSNIATPLDICDPMDEDSS